MKFAVKWLVLEKIILSDIAQTQKDIHVVHLLEGNVTHEAQDNYVTLSRSKEAK